MTQESLASVLQQYLWFPLVVSIVGVIATAFFSYLSTYLLNKKTQTEEKRAKTIDLIDRLILETNKFTIMLNKLSDDLETLRYFSIKNLDILLPISWKLRTLSDNAVLFSDDLRRKVIETVDLSTLLVDEINNLERYPVKEYTDHLIRQAELEKEYRAFNSDLLGMGIWIKFNEAKNTYEPTYTNPSDEKKQGKRDKTLEAAGKINADFKRTLDNSQSKLNAINADTANKRTLLNTRLLGALTKLDNLGNDLTDYKISLITKRRHFLFLSF